MFAKNKDVKEIGEFAIVKFITKQERKRCVLNVNWTAAMYLGKYFRIWTA